VRVADLPIDRPVATLMLLLSGCVLGVVAVKEMPVDFLPVVERPEVEVQVPFPGSHPLEALDEVARPIEEEIATIPAVQRIQTEAVAGHVEIDAECDWSTDLNLARLEVKEAVERARPRFPPGVGRARIEVSRGGGPASGSIVQGRLSAERDLSESWDLLDQRLKRPLERTRGVARVDLYGVEPLEVRIDVDFAALQRHGVDAGRVLELLDASNVDRDAGVVRGDVARYDVRTLGRFGSVDEIRALRIGDGLRLADVADVALRQPPLDYGRHLDRRYAIGIDVYKEPSANTVETVARVRAKLDEVRADPQLEGVSILVWQDAGEEVLRSLTGLRNAGLWGGLLAVVVLFAFLRDPRTTGIVAAAIPFSLVVACGAMYALGSQFDVLTLLGLMLGVGMLVDNAVVVIENIHRLQGLGRPPREAAREGVRAVWLAVLAATSTSVIVWSWLLVTEKSPLTIYMGGVALTICLAVACSLVVSVTFIPLCASRLPATTGGDRGGLRRLRPRYERLLAWTLERRTLTLGALLLMAGSAAWPLGRLEKQGEPRMRQRGVSIEYEVHDPATVEVLEGYVDEVEAWLEARRDELGYDSVYSYYREGRGASTRLYLPRERTSLEAVAALRRRLQRGLPRIAGVTLEVGERMWHRRRGPQEGKRLVSLALHGEDPELLIELGRQVEERLAGGSDVVEVRGPAAEGRREVRILVDPDKARAFGLTPRAVAETIAFVYRGRRLERFRRAGSEVEVLTGLAEDRTPGLATLAGVPVPRPDGTTVPLQAVARLETIRTPPEVRRLDRQTTVWVEVQLDERAVATTEDAQARVEAAMAGFVLPDGYWWDWGEWGRERVDVLETMGRGVALSLLIVVLLMAALFESFSQPLAIVITLPLAFFGAFWALWGAGYVLDAVAFIGVIILIGIVVNNGIVMVDHVNALRAAGRDRRAALIEGCGDRLRPVLMTAITTIFGLVPLALSGPTVAGAYIDSLAVAVIGGLATSTVFTLVGLPVWYATIEDLGAFLRRLLPARAPPTDPEERPVTARS